MNQEETTVIPTASGNPIRYPFFRSLRRKIIVPYLLLALVIAALSTYVMSRIIANSLKDRFENLLLTTAGDANDVFTLFEEDQLANWRRIAFTQGVPEGVADANVNTLLPLVVPILLDAQVEEVDLVSLDGQAIARLDSAGNALPAPDYTQWSLWAELQNSRTQERKDRFAGLESVDGTLMFYTAGLITNLDGEATGILFVGTQLPTITAYLQRAVLANITLYQLDGTLVASSHIQTSALTLPAGLVTQVKEKPQERQVDLAGDAFVQILTPWEVTFYQKPLGIVGVTLPLEYLNTSLGTDRLPLIIVFTLAVVFTLVIGHLLTNGIVNPIDRLRHAAQEVAQGDLSVQVPAPPPAQADEVGTLSHRFNEMVTQLQQRRYIEDMFGRYVGDNIAKQILSGKTALGGQQVVATALFSDIRDFTTLTERSHDQLDRLIAELNEYYTVMQQAVDDNGGVINKFGGDSILALFGAPIPHTDHAARAIRAAIDMEYALTGLNERRLARGDLPLRIGIGINSGEMLVGNLGSEKRREYTVLGDSVNAAKRLSDLNKETPFHNSIFASESTMANMPPIPGWRWDSLGPVFVKGKESSIIVYALALETAETV